MTLTHLLSNYLSYYVSAHCTAFSRFAPKKDPPLRVAFIHGDSDVVSGSELALIDLIQSLDGRMFRPTVITRREGPYTKLLRENGIPVRIVPLARFDRRAPLPFLRAVRDLVRHFADDGTDLVHVNNVFPTQYALPAARLAGIPCLCHARSTVYTRYGVRSSLSALADRVLCVSGGVRNALLALGMPARKLVTAFDGIDLEKHTAPPRRGGGFRAEFGIPAAALVIGQFGQIIERKGIACFLEMAKIIAGQLPQARFLLVGDQQFDGGAYRKKMEKYSRLLGLEGKVIFTGFRTDVPRIMAEVDIHVLATEAEGTGLVVLEAGAAGKPVVATNVPGVNEIIVDGMTGILVPERDPEAFAHKVLLLARNRWLAGKMGARAHRRITEHFTLPKMTEQIQNIYLSMLRDKLPIPGVTREYSKAAL